MPPLPEEPRLDASIIHEIEKGVGEFNSGKFFECHDTLEEVWRGTRGPARDFLQGLIQISVGFYHLRNGNLVGGTSQLDRGLKKLENYGDSYLGMELAGLRRETRIWLDNLGAGRVLREELAALPKFRFIGGQA